MTPFRRASLAALGVGLFSGVLCVAAGADPLGSTSASSGLVVLSVTAVCWIGSTAPRRMLAWLVLIAGVASLWAPGIVVGLVVSAAAYVIAPDGNPSATAGPESPYASAVNAGLAGVALNLAARSELDIVFGLSAAVAIVVGSMIVIAGLSGRQRAARRVVLFGMLALITFAFVAAAGLGTVSATAVDELREGERLVRQGLDHLGDADLDAAIVALRAANGEFSRAEDRLSSPILRVGALVPVVAQHREAAVTVSAEAADLTALVSDLIEDVGPDALNVDGARIDLDSLSALGASMEEIGASLERLDAKIRGVSSPWLLAPATERLDDLSTEVQEQSVRAENAIEALTALPDLLGARGERVYLVMFTTPSEARGLGGFTANWAEITARDGRISVSRFGRTDDLDGAAGVGERRVTGPSDWLERYGQFGFTNGPEGGVGAVPFKNVTMSPLMSSTGSVIAELYPQSGGRTVDGVFAADVYVVAELLRFTGPVEISGTNRTLRPGNAAEFLLHQQYFIEEKGDRVDLLDEVARGVIDVLLGDGQQLDPADLRRSIGPLVEQGRLAGWASRESEQDLLERSGLAGTLLANSGDDLVTFALNNSAGNKIDYFLRTAGQYDSTVNAVTGAVDGKFDITMENVEPSRPQPRYVVGNVIDEPDGTNQTYVSVFTALPPSEVTIDGAQVPVDYSMEAGYHVSSVLVLIPPGETRTISVRTHGAFDPLGEYSLVVRSPPTVGSTPIDVRVNVEQRDGTEQISRRLETAGVDRVVVDLGAGPPP